MCKTSKFFFFIYMVSSRFTKLVLVICFLNLSQRRSNERSDKEELLKKEEVVLRKSSLGRFKVDAAPYFGNGCLLSLSHTRYGLQSTVKGHRTLDPRLNSEHSLLPATSSRPHSLPYSMIDAELGKRLRDML